MKRKDSRILIATALIIAGFISALGLAVISSHKNNFLVTSRSLLEGHVIEPSDFHVEKASLWNGANYLSDKYSIVGTVVKRFIGENEFLSGDMLATTPSEIKYRTVPLSVMAADMPANILPGQMVDLYYVPPIDENNKTKGSKLVLGKIRVLALDRKGQNLGNAAIVSFAVPVESVLEILNATRMGRIVVIAIAT